MRTGALIEKALAVVGAVALAMLVVGTASLALAMQRGFRARDEPSALETFAARRMRAWSVPRRAKALRNPVTPNAEALADARAHWADHCAICHANNGSGDTAIGNALYPRAPDMRRSPTQNLSDGELYYIIQHGIRLSGMPAWGQPVDDDEDSWKLVAFIRYLPSLTAEEERDMEKLNPKSAMEREEEKEEEEFL